MKNLTPIYLHDIIPGYTNKGYPVPKWITFSLTMLNEGWDVVLQQSKTTVSKYIHITKGSASYKIRFSNHKANKEKESSQDSDYYIGVGHNGIITTEQLIAFLTTEKL